MADTANQIIANNTTYNIVDTKSGYTSNQGTLRHLECGTGLYSSGGDEYGTITSTGTVHLELKNTATSSLTAATRGSTSGREYPIGLDGDGSLSVNIPWVNTTLKAGTNISISSNTINLANVGTMTNHNGFGSSQTTILSGSITYVGPTSAPPTFAVGTYFLHGMIRWTGNSGGSTSHTTNGYRRLWFSTQSSTDGAGIISRWARSQIKAYSNNKGETITQQVDMIWNNTTANQPLYLYAYHNAGQSLTFTYSGFQAVRLA